MVKRKADQSLDDWLREGEEVARLNRAAIVVTSEPPSQVACPVTDKVLPGEVNGAEVVTSVEEGSAEGEASNWFWELLANAGYETW